MTQIWLRSDPTDHALQTRWGGGHVMQLVAALQATPADRMNAHTVGSDRHLHRSVPSPA